MNNLEEYMKEWNLIYTGTIDLNSSDMDETEVDYNDSFSLFHLISSFNKCYLSFKKEYDKLEKLDLGEYVEVLNFDKFKFNNDNYRILRMYIDKPSITEHIDTILYLREVNGEIKSFISNDTNDYDDNFYYDEVKLDNEVAVKYLDLFEKYSVLLDAYTALKSKDMYIDNDNSYMYTVIDNYFKSGYKDCFLTGLKNLKIYFGTSYDEGAVLSVNLGDNFGLDYDNCIFKIVDDEVSTCSEDFDKMFNNVHINKKCIRKR